MKERVEVGGEKGWSEVEDAGASHRVSRLPSVRPCTPSLVLCLHQPALSPLRHSKPGIWSNSELLEGPKGLGSYQGPVGETVGGVRMAATRQLLRGEGRSNSTGHEPPSASFPSRPPQMTLVFVLE